MNYFKVFLLVILSIVGLSLTSEAQNSALTINSAGTVINPISVINFPGSIEVGGTPLLTNGQSNISFDNGAITSSGSGSLTMDNLIISYPGYIYGSLTPTYISIDPNFRVLDDFLGSPAITWASHVLNGNWMVGNFSSTLYTGNANGETNFPPFNLTITVTNNFTLSLSGSTNVTLVCSSNAPLTITLPSLQGYVATILQAGTNTIYVSNSVANGGFSIPAPWVLGGGMTNVFTNQMTLAGYFGHSITLGYLNPTNDIPINIGFTKPEISDIVTNLAGVGGVVSGNGFGLTNLNTSITYQASLANAAIPITGGNEYWPVQNPGTATTGFVNPVYWQKIPPGVINTVWVNDAANTVGAGTNLVFNLWTNTISANGGVANSGGASMFSVSLYAPSSGYGTNVILNLVVPTNTVACWQITNSSPANISAFYGSVTVSETTSSH